MSSCQKYIEQMNSYLDGELPAAQISDLLEHLEECPSCRARFEAMKVVAFEMRHMQRKPPAGLHDNIMQAVRNTDQRRPSSWLKAVTTIAACAALFLLISNTNFFRMAGNYLFPTETNQNSAIPESANDSAGPIQEPALGDAVTGSAEPQDGGMEGYALAPAAEPPAEEPADEGEPGQPVEPRTKVAAEMPQQEDTGADNSIQEPASGGQADQKETEEQAGDEPAARAVPYAQQSDGVLAAEVYGNNSDSGSFRVPPLDTDEAFAFYCVALGTGNIPNVFPKEQIIRFVEKKCLYIYVDAGDFTQEGCAKLLEQAGFNVVDEPTNLPQTDASSDYGLIVIYEYDVTK